MEWEERGTKEQADMVHGMLALADCPVECTCCVQCCAESILTEVPSSSCTCSLHKSNSKEILTKLVLLLNIFNACPLLWMELFHCCRPKGHFKTWFYTYFKIK